ncbi:mediator of RNA polymerase II transcription subunit 16 [Copidosoma floridanum]|uniref:mediator of RNA polymerase II transcription subunit 16 n=1 Tax=Copidosoma floridanum TaxID=29053 RepID=UPI0006C9CE1B|nr:mediator of RNA polymerase II transcription subunit 16 [Copidosoma floridanum]
MFTNINMDLLYTVNRKTFSKSSFNQESPYDQHSLCSLSSRNIIAFTSTTELHDKTGKTWGCHVYVCDLNMPWHPYKILTNEDRVTALKWDLAGEKLVIADLGGLVQLWTFKDYIINEWISIGSHCFTGEHILGVAWFHNGKRTILNNEKKNSPLYNEKFSHLSYAPSVKQFGGRAAQGILVVTNTGLLGTVMITQDKQNPICSATESLATIRQRITAVDISYAKNGQFLVAVSGGNFTLPIRCFRVSVRKSEERCSITSQALPSFFLQDGASKDDISNATITHLKFAVSETADSLVVAVNSDVSGFIEVWELIEKTQPIHKMFQTKPCEPFKTVVWQHQALYRCHSTIAALTSTKLSVVSPTSYIIVALTDSSIQCLSHDGLKEVAISSLNTSWRQDEPLNKYSKTSATISCIDVSWLGCLFLLIDTRGSLYTYRLYPEGSAMSISYACTLLEYCLVTGLDWLDLLFCLKSSLIESLCDRFDQSFNRQSPQIQQYHYMQHLSIMISLYRMLASGQSKAADLSSLFMLHAVAIAFKSLLRPSDTFHDKVPAERLPSVITENNITDVDKVLLHIEPKEFTVEPYTLQSLQQLIQWVADLSLNLLVRLPEQRMQMKSSGYELIKDHKALNILRELLVIIRIWGLLRPSCLPVFLKSADNIDVLGLVFQLLSKLVQPSGDGLQIDDQLIDDCILLPNQIMIPQIHRAKRITAVATPNLFYHSLPHVLEYGTTPTLTYSPQLNQVEGCMRNSQCVDAVRHVYLGKNAMTVKECTRCCTKSQIHVTTRTAAIRAWEQRWAKGCPCGGPWRFRSG